MMMIRCPAELALRRLPQAPIAHVLKKEMRLVYGSIEVVNGHQSDKDDDDSERVLAAVVSL